MFAWLRAAVGGGFAARAASRAPRRAWGDDDRARLGRPLRAGVSGRCRDRQQPHRVPGQPYHLVLASAAGQAGEEVRRVPAHFVPGPPQQPERLRGHRGHGRVEVEGYQVITLDPRFEPDPPAHCG